MLACLVAGGLFLLAAWQGPLATVEVPFRPQVREMDPRLKQIIERERYGKKGYIKKDGKWVKAVPTPQTSGLVKKLKDDGKPRLKIHMIDVSKGESILFQTPSGKNILLDAGRGPQPWHDYDYGEKRVLPYLKYLGVKKLDAVMISHPHYDHCGGLPAVMKVMEVDELIDSGHKHTTTKYYKVLQAAMEKGLKYRRVRAGDKLDLDPALKIKVFNPPSPTAYKDKNNSSVVMKITYENVSILLTGDASKKAEPKVVRSYGRDLKAQILKVGHHGSKTSTTESFLSKVMPEIAIISCGFKNRYGHPTKEVLRRLERKKVKVYRTDLDSTIVITTDGNFLTAEAFSEVPPEYEGYIIGDTEKEIYYLPRTRYYVRVYPGRRRYFKTEAEARKAGFKRSKY